MNDKRLKSFTVIDDYLWIPIPLAFVGPLHASHKIGDFIGIEAFLVGYRCTVNRLLPTGPGRSERIGTKSAFMITRPTSLSWIFRVIESVR